MRIEVEMPGVAGPQEIYITNLAGSFQVHPEERTFLIQDISGTAHLKGLQCAIRIQSATGTFNAQPADTQIFEAVARAFADRIRSLTK